MFSFVSSAWGAAFGRIHVFKGGGGYVGGRIIVDDEKTRFFAPR
jgi:hypothetical protein